MKKYVKYDNVEYFMPFLFCNDIFIPVLNELLKNEINPVKYVYGSPYCAWASGRIPKFKINNLLLLENYLQKLKKYNLTPTFTFNKINNIDNVIKDEYSNNLLDIACENDSHFIVANDDLYKHIKARYPNAKMHCSVIMAIKNFIKDKNFNETKFYNDMLEKYEIVVIRPEYTLENLEKLNKIISDISRIEVLVNQTCQYNCPLHIEHYNYFEKINDLFFNNNNKNIDSEFICPLNKVKKNINQPLRFHQKQIEQLVNIGVKNFKLQGRDYKFNLLFEDLYTFLFNKEISKEEIRHQIDLISARLIQDDKKTATILAMKN